MNNEQKPKTKTEKNIKKEVEVIPETKRDKFKRIASDRQGKAIDRIALLGKIAENPQNYEFDEEQIHSLFEGLELFTAKVKQKFLDCINIKEIKQEFKVAQIDL